MIRLTIVSQKHGTVYKDFQSQDEVNAYLTEIAATKHWGKPERWVHEDDLEVMGEDKTKAIAVEYVGSIEEDKKRYQFAAEYTFVQEDMTAKIEQQRINETSLAFLYQTDWKVIRAIEKGESIPEDLKAQRQAARDAIVR